VGKLGKGREGEDIGKGGERWDDEGEGRGEGGEGEEDKEEKEGEGV